MAFELKEEGNKLFQNSDYENAIKKYARVRLFTQPFIPKGNQDEIMSMMVKSKTDGISSEKKIEVVDLQAQTSLNMSTCFFKLGNYKKAVDKATESINLKKTYKAYYRRGIAYSKLLQFDNAASDLEAALKTDVNDPMKITNELNQFRAKAA